MQRMGGGRRRYLPVLFVFLGVILSVNIFSATDYHSASVAVKLKADIGSAGQTRIAFPPVGEIRARTHWLPVRLSLELRSVNLAFLRAVVFSAPQATVPLLEEMRQGARRLLVLFTLKMLGLAAAGGVFALIMLGPADAGQALWAGLAGAAVVLLLAVGLFYTYDLQAFERMEYHGVIEAAPWALNLAWEALGKVEELGERVRLLAGNLYSALQQLEELEPIGLFKAELVALHISDVHNNPVAFDFVKEVIASFPVDFILDTGDLTDWGTALEAEITNNIENLALPYAFVSGNHETPEVLEKLGSISNVLMIGTEPQSVFGVKIAGAADPAALRQLPEPASLAVLNELAAKINSEWKEAKEKPDIFMIHNHRVAEALGPGLFPVVVCGHAHKQGVQQKGETVYINAGTTGAAGIRGFQGKEPLPYSLALLYFVFADQKPVLKAVDSVHITGLGTGFSLQRTFVEYSRNPTQNVEFIR